jgi:SH3 domain protein
MKKMPVKKLLPLILSLLASIGAAQAETVYVTDTLSLSIRSKASNNAPIIKSLPSGTPLTVIDGKTKAGFLHVRLDNGTEGYIQTSLTKKEPPSSEVGETNNKSLKLLQTEIIGLRAELKVAKDAITPGTSLEKSLTLERDKLSLELGEIKQAAAGVIQLKNDRDELQERVVSAERDLQQLKLENQALKDTTNQDWFLYGGILSFFSVILGFILPKLGWRRKSNWDSY